MLLENPVSTPIQQHEYFRKRSISQSTEMLIKLVARFGNEIIVLKKVIIIIFV